MGGMGGMGGFPQNFLYFHFSYEYFRRKPPMSPYIYIYIYIYITC
jgi:hypothetical protein